MSGDVVERLRLGALEAQRRHGVNPESTIFGKAADLITSQAAEIERLRRSGPWEPIATAPKDWSDVLVYVPDFPSDFRKVGEAYYNPETGKWRSPASRKNIKPTHWCPLPAPPLTNGGENGR